MKVFYRISDKGNPKEKLASAGKKECLLNAIQEFGPEMIYVIADNCEPTTISFLRDESLSFEETSLGNSKSFVYMVNKIIDTLSPEESVYLLEDDYIHLPGSRNLLLEGLELSDYVTLYDHPDKYILNENGGNPFNYKKINLTRLYVTKSSHWRDVDSTTMTFACRVKTLQEDYDIWLKYTQGKIPDDFHGFMQITQNKLSDFISYLCRKRKKEAKIIFKNIISRRKINRLISAVPSHATHAEIKWLSPVIDWKNK